MPRKNLGEKNFGSYDTGHTQVDDRTDLRHRRQKPEGRRNVLGQESSAHRRREKAFRPGDSERSAHAAGERTKSALERLRAIQDVNDVFGNIPEMKKWAEAYLERVKSGDRTERNGLFEQAVNFVDGAVLPRDIAITVDRLLGREKRIKEDYKRYTGDKPFNLLTVAKALGCSRREAADLVAFANLFDNIHALNVVVAHTQEGDFKHLSDLHVNEDEAKAVTAIMKDKRHINDLTQAMFDKAAPVLTKEMTNEALLDFADHIQVYLKNFNRGSVRKYFDNPERKKACQELLAQEASLASMEAKAEDAQLSLHVVLGKIDRYEYVFGNLTREEFEKIFPNWQKLRDQWFKQNLIKKYGLGTGKEIAVIGTGVPDRVVGGPEKGGVKSVDLAVRPNVRIVKEEQLLKLRDEHPLVLSGPSKFVVPFTESIYKPKKDALARIEKPGKAELGPVSPRKSERRSDEDMEVFIPLDRDESIYRAAIEGGISEMKVAVEMAERTEIFLEKVWPQFLVARADRAAGDALAKKVEEAGSLLDSSIREPFLRLVELSKDVEINTDEINQVARELRANADLHEHGCYVHTEVISRTRRRMGEAGEPVKLVVSLSFQVARIAEYHIQGQRADVVYLGPRIDKIDKDIKAAGRRYSGDGHSVVMMEAIWDMVNIGIIPRLNDGTELWVGRGKQVHRVEDLVVEALRRDFGVNPDKAKCKEIVENGFEAIAAHELQHATDKITGVHGEMSDFIERRVREEVNAYLASIIRDNTTADNPPAPFADLVNAVMMYFNQRQDPFSRWNDLMGIYEKAGERILLALAKRLGRGDVDEKLLKDNYLEGGARVLESALKLSGDELRVMAREIIAELNAESKAGYQTRPTAQPVEVRAPRGGKKSEKTSEQVDSELTTAPEQAATGTKQNFLDKLKKFWGGLVGPGQTTESSPPILELEEKPQTEEELLPAPPKEKLSLSKLKEKLSNWQGLEDLSVLARQIGRHWRAVELALITTFLVNAVDGAESKVSLVSDNSQDPRPSISDTNNEQPKPPVKFKVITEDERARFQYDMWAQEREEDVASFKHGVWGFVERYLNDYCGIDRNCDYVMNAALNRAAKAGELSVKNYADNLYNSVVGHFQAEALSAIKRSGKFGIDAQSSDAEVDEWARHISEKRAGQLGDFLRDKVANSWKSQALDMLK